MGLPLSLGLILSEANYGEDVKEYSCYLNGTPTHSYRRLERGMRN
jgi:hypothetical protein